MWNWKIDLPCHLLGHASIEAVSNNILYIDRLANPTLTQQPPEMPLSMIAVFALYQPLARRAAPEPPEPPPMTR